MILKDMRDEVKSNLGNRSTTVISDIRMTLWINQTEVELVSAFPFFENADKRVTTMVIGQAEYSLPSDCIAIYSVKDVTLKRRIRRSNFRKFDNIDETVSGDPTHYIRFGNFIQFNTLPNHADTLQLRFGKSISSMSGDNDTPTINSNWHEALILGGTMRGLRAIKEYQEMAVLKNEYLMFVRSREAEWETEEWDEEFGLELVR